jgi:hypothetical protein
MNIRFLCDPKHYGIFDPPVPAAKALPEYYRAMPGATTDTPTFNASGDPGSTMKKCMPVFDSMSAGYVIRLVTDVYVDNADGGGKSFVWPANDFTAISSHPGGQFPGLPIGPEYDQTSAYKFHNPWQVVTDPGYSCLFVHPMWHYGLPFHVFPGLVDTDQHPVPVNFPFLMRSDFTGYLRKGTPIVQVIPFRREEFVGSDGEREESSDRAWERAKLQFSNRYKEHFRSLKLFRSATNDAIVEQGVPDGDSQ